MSQTNPPPPYTGEFYLTISRAARGYKDLRARITDREPILQLGEITLLVKISLPRALFARPLLRASISVPSEGVSPPVVSAEVADNIAEAVRIATGLDVRLTVEGVE